MAYLKIFPIKVTDKKALDYITNPDKTDEKLLVSSFGCSPETADLEFSMTREMAKKNGMDKGDNLAFHLIQSFKPGEVDAENAHRLGQQFADEVLKGKYEYVISTHVDKNHIHNHIIFNAASFVDHHKYVSNKRSYHKICRISNRICQENCKSAKNPKAYRTKHQAEYQLHDSLKKSFRISVLPKSQALIKSRSKLKILNLNRLLPSGKNRNCRKSRIHWISFSRISLRYSMLQRSVQTYFRQKGNLFLSQEINKSTLANHSFSSKSSQGFRPISSQVTPYGAPPEV